MELIEGFPKFVTIEFSQSSLRLEAVRDGVAHYYRDGGMWGLIASRVGGYLISEKCSIKSISELKLFPCTFAIWKESNGEYAPESITE